MSIDFHEGEKLFSHIHTERVHGGDESCSPAVLGSCARAHAADRAFTALGTASVIAFFFFFPKEGGLVSESHSPHYYPFASSRIFTYTHIWLVTQLEKVWTKADTHTHTHT